MAKFSFRMATLLRLRESVRDERRGELADAYRVDEVLQSRQQQLAAETARQRELCRQLSRPGTVNIDQLLESQRYEMTLKVVQKQLQQQRETVAAEIERRREALVEANREVRTLEQLREKQLAAYRHEENLRDIKRLDEVAALGALRQEVV